jgi:hypothetical protein
LAIPMCFWKYTWSGAAILILLDNTNFFPAEVTLIFSIAYIYEIHSALLRGVVYETSEQV